MLSATSPKIAVRDLLFPLLLIAAGVLAYHNSFNGPFIFDDHATIVSNPEIRHLRLAWGATLNHETTASRRPVLTLSLAIDYALSGLNVAGYHATNLAIHLAAALVLFGVTRRTLLRSAEDSRSDNRKSQIANRQSAAWLALAVAMIWLVHPLQTSAVTYIVQRAESLMGLFYLLVLYCFIRGLGSPRRRLWHAGAVACGALGVATKEVAATAPVVLLLYDYVFVSGSLVRALRQRWGLYAGLAATWSIPVLMSIYGPASVSRGLGQGIGMLDYLRTQAGVLIWYLRLCFWPDRLALSYPWPIARTWGEAAAPGLLIVMLLAATAWGVWRRSWLGFLGAWFFLILAPSSSFVPIATETVAEHRMYLPLAAVIALVVMGGYRVAAMVSSFRAIAVLAVWFIAGVVLLVTVVTLIGLTVRRNEDYQSELAIWRDNVAKWSGDSRAHYNLGQALAKQDDYAGAIAEYDKAVRLNPGNYEAEYKWGLTLEAMEKLDDAAAHYEQALRIHPRLFHAHFRLGLMLARQNKMAPAIDHLRAAATIDASNADAHYFLALALIKAGQPDEATPHWARALSLDPTIAQRGRR